MQRSVKGGCVGDRVIDKTEHLMLTITGTTPGARVALMSDDPKIGTIEVSGDDERYDVRPAPRPGLEIRGPLPVAVSDLNTYAFDRMQAGLHTGDIDALKALARASFAPCSYGVTFSEDEGRPIAEQRAEADASALRTLKVSNVTAESSADGTVGNYDYKSQRKAVVFFADEAPAPLVVADNGRVRSGDQRYANYHVAESLTEATMG